jgi:hypothetical protein
MGSQPAGSGHFLHLRCRHKYSPSGMERARTVLSDLFFRVCAADCAFGSNRSVWSLFLALLVENPGRDEISPLQLDSYGCILHDVNVSVLLDPVHVWDSLFHFSVCHFGRLCIQGFFIYLFYFYFPSSSSSISET